MSRDPSNPITVPPGISGGIDNFIGLLTEFATEASFILEIGVGLGDGSTYAFQEGIRSADPLHISVDENVAVPWKWMPRVPWWHFVIGDSRSAHTAKAVMGLCDGRPADLIYIDTVHTYEHMQAELPVWLPFAHDDTRWVFHDSRMHGVYNHMNVAIIEFGEKHGWEFEEYSIEAHGLAGLRKRR